MNERKLESKRNPNINLVDLFVYLRARWKWFLLSCLLFLGWAAYRYATAPLVFNSSITVFIKDPSRTRPSGIGLDVFDNYINKVNISSEILQFRSRRILREAIRRINADVNYQVRRNLRWAELYKEAPFRIEFPDTLAPPAAFVATLKNNNEVVLSDFDGSESRSYTATFGRPIKTVAGTMIVWPSPSSTIPDWRGQRVRVSKRPVEEVVVYYHSNLHIQQEDKQSSILSLSLNDSSPFRAEDLLNTLITVYNEEAINDKKKVSVNSGNFLAGRIDVLEAELGQVESQIEAFRQRNNIMDLEAESSRYAQESEKASTNEQELNVQLRQIQAVRDHVVNSAYKGGLIPRHSGIKDLNIENQIDQYNALKLRRDQLMDGNSESNPVVVELNNSLTSLRKSIIGGIDNNIQLLSSQLRNARAVRTEARGGMASLPRKRRELLSIERQQKSKEQLYLLLLNKREENSLAQAMIDDNAKIIDVTVNSNTPISPNKIQTLSLGLLLGLAFPAAFFLAQLFLNTRVYNRKELEDATDIPLLGEIPRQKNIRKLGQGLVVKMNGNDMISEAFRILRTNLRFMANKDKSAQAVMFTSLGEGAGKSFISHNLARTFTFSGQSVVLIDLDLRKATLSKGLNLRNVNGVSNYLADNSIGLENILHQDAECKELYVIPAGSIPPNPAELLMLDRLDKLIGELSSRYDYIFIDHVPINSVADASIANRVVDVTVFVLRAGQFDKRQIPELEKIYEEKKMKNMALILNRSDMDRTGYGYGYSYGYGYGGKKNKFDWRRLFKRAE